MIIAIVVQFEVSLCSSKLRHPVAIQQVDTIVSEEGITYKFRVEFTLALVEK
jgi:hypothetical protein